MRRCGIQTPEQGVELARLITTLPGLTFRGVMSHQTLGADDPKDRETRFTEGRRMIQKWLDVKDGIEAAGIPVEIVSSGEVVDVRRGGRHPRGDRGPGWDVPDNGDVLPLHVRVRACRQGADHRHQHSPGPAWPSETPGLNLWGHIKGVPGVEGMPGVTVRSMDAQSSVLQVEGGAHLEIGDQVTLLPSQQDAMVSRWDQYVAVRNGKVEAVWDIAARGRHN